MDIIPNIFNCVSRIRLSKITLICLNQKIICILKVYPTKNINQDLLKVEIHVSKSGLSNHLNNLSC